MINWHLSKQDIRWPVARGLKLELIEFLCFLKVDRWPTGFWLERRLMSG